MRDTLAYAVLALAAAALAYWAFPRAKTHPDNIFYVLCWLAGGLSAALVVIAWLSASAR